MRRTFNSIEEFNELFNIFKWAERKCGVEAEGKWGTVVIYAGDGPKAFHDPMALIIYMDRLIERQKKKLCGYFYIHGPLNSYLGFADEPWCEHFDVHHNKFSTRNPQTDINIQQEREAQKRFEEERLKREKEKEEYLKWKAEEDLRKKHADEFTKEILKKREAEDQKVN